MYRECRGCLCRNYGVWVRFFLRYAAAVFYWRPAVVLYPFLMIRSRNYPTHNDQTIPTKRGHGVRVYFPFRLLTLTHTHTTDRSIYIYSGTPRVGTPILYNWNNCLRPPNRNYPSVIKKIESGTSRKVQLYFVSMTAIVFHTIKSKRNSYYSVLFF